MTLVCANHEMPNHLMGGAPSTMVQTPGWHALTTVSPPTKEFIASFNPSSGIPVRAYICNICGYTELYAGSISDPKVWKGESSG